MEIVPIVDFCLLIFVEFVMRFEKVLANVRHVILVVVCKVSWLQDHYSLASHEVLNHHLVALGENWEVLVVSHESLGAYLNCKHMLSPESEDQLV